MFKSISKVQSKHIKRLHRKKNRQIFNEFIVEGTKTVLEFLNSTYQCKGVFAKKEWFEENTLKLSAQDCFYVNTTQLQQISTFKNPQPVLALFEIPKEKNRIKEDFVLYLDDIRDPGNLGTIIRSADWFGLQNIYCSPTCADAFNSKVIQASMGSSARIGVHYIHFENLLQKYPKHQTVLADMNGTALKKYQWAKQSILVIGNEANGVSETIRNVVKNKVSISNKGNAESLNASISTAILLHNALG